MGLDDRMRDAMRGSHDDADNAADAGGASPDELRRRARSRVRVRRGTRLGAAAMAIVLVVGAVVITRDDHHAQRELASGRKALGAFDHHRTGRTTGPFAIALGAGHPAASIVDAIAVARGNKLSARTIAALKARL